MSLRSIIRGKTKRYVIGMIVSSVLATSTIGLSTVGKGILSKIPAVNKITDTSAAQNTDNTTYKVLRVVDGDTFRIKYKGKNVSVRLIGIDTPESVHKDTSRNTVWGKKASVYAKKKLTDKKVRLEFDKQKTDRYGRLLAYVYITSSKGNEVMFNKLLVKKGYARAAYYTPNGKYKSRFEILQKQAKNKKRGFWKAGFKKAFPTITEE